MAAKSRPLNFRWVIIVGLVTFAFFPVFVLEALQIITLPQQLEQELTERYKNEVRLAIRVMKETINADAEKVAIIAENDNIKQFLHSWKNGTMNLNIYNIAFNELIDCFNSSQDLPSVIGEGQTRCLELSLDAVEYHTDQAQLLSNDNLTRIFTLVLNRDTNSIIVNNRTKTITGSDAEDYYPYYSIKSHFPNKRQSTSSIIRWRNFTTFGIDDFLLDNNQRPIPVNVHTRIIQNKTGGHMGLLCAVVSAEPFIEVVQSFDDPDLPATLIDRFGNILYSSDESLLYTKISGYYETILTAGVDQIIVDPYGFQNEITIFEQTVLDWDLSQSLLVVKIVPRRIILRTLQNTIIQGMIVLVVFVLLATVLSIFVTRMLTGRLRQISDAIQQISRGNFDIELDTSGSDELAELAKGIRRMTKSLSFLLHEEEKRD